MFHEYATYFTVKTPYHFLQPTGNVVLKCLSGTLATRTGKIIWSKNLNFLLWKHRWFNQSTNKCLIHQWPPDQSIISDHDKPLTAWSIIPPDLLMTVWSINDRLINHLPSDQSLTAWSINVRLINHWPPDHLNPALSITPPNQSMIAWWIIDRLIDQCHPYQSFTAGLLLTAWSIIKRLVIHWLPMITRVTLWSITAWSLNDRFSV